MTVRTRYTGRTTAPRSSVAALFLAPMMKRRSIRFMMWTALALLFLLVFILAGAGLYAVSLYKNQVRDIAWRVNVLPVAARFDAAVGELRAVLGELRGIRRTRLRLSPPTGRDDRLFLEGLFQKSLFEVKQAYDDYQRLLEERIGEIGVDDSFKKEFSTLHEIRRVLRSLSEITDAPDWGETERNLTSVDAHLERLHYLAGTLPSYLHSELKMYSRSMQRRARWLNAIVLVCVSVSAVLTLLLIRLSYVWIFRPLGALIDGSRKVAAGIFQHRIRLASQDEMAELAEAMNRMTERFEEIREDLDEKVRQRSRELIRSERLASVGFLAAGVAHEINNPLTAISTCAESLQRRLTLTTPEDAEPTARYLKMIEDEAFRCKGITEKLLSFARSEKKDREPTDLAALIVDMVEMTRQHDAYRRKDIRLDLPDSLWMTANSQEMKQVVLNLLANALDSTERDGRVTVRLRRERDDAVLTVRDDGVGMDESTLQNIFEPFFTRRKHGQGTGLGLSITHRIVEEHRGRIEARSDGPGRGSTFLVALPLHEADA